MLHVTVWPASSCPFASTATAVSCRVTSGAGVGWVGIILTAATAAGGVEPGGVVVGAVGGDVAPPQAYAPSSASSVVNRQWCLMPSCGTPMREPPPVGEPDSTRSRRVMTTISRRRFGWLLRLGSGEKRDEIMSSAKRVSRTVPGLPAPPTSPSSPARDWSGPPGRTAAER